MEDIYLGYNMSQTVNFKRENIINSNFSIRFAMARKQNSRNNNSLLLNFRTKTNILCSSDHIIIGELDMEFENLCNAR